MVEQLWKEFVILEKHLKEGKISYQQLYKIKRICVRIKGEAADVKDGEVSLIMDYVEKAIEGIETEFRRNPRSENIPSDVELLVVNLESHIREVAERKKAELRKKEHILRELKR